MSRQKVAILYGIGEGDYHGRAFVSGLKRAGFDVIRDSAKADIVITHSGGCFFLPPLELDQKFVLINPPYWPGKPLVVSTMQKIYFDFMDFARDGKLHVWFWKTAVNLAHIARFLIKTLVIMRGAHKRRFYEALRDENAAIIRSSADTFLAPDADQLLEQKVGKVISFYRLPGQHDTCWRDPEPYIRIIKEISRVS